MEEKKNVMLYYRTLNPNTTAFNRVITLFNNSLYGDCGKEKLIVNAIHALYNPTLVSQFVSYMKLTESRFKSDPTLFRDTSWRKRDLKNKARREFVYNKFLDMVKRFDWNTEDRIKSGMVVVASIHGTSLAIAWKVAEKGFVAISKLDEGFYGKGIYFTTHALYALPYFGTKAHPSILVTYVLPGEPYPVIEAHESKHSLLGKGLKGSAISHYVVTKRDGYVASPNSEVVYDELVFAQESALLPAFLLELDDNNFQALVKQFNRTIPMDLRDAEIENGSDSSSNSKGITRTANTVPKVKSNNDSRPQELGTNIDTIIEMVEKSHENDSSSEHTLNNNETKIIRTYTEQ